MSKKKYLVIVESPKKAKTIGKILGPEYEVLATFGHIQDLPKSKIGVDLKDFSITYVISPGKEKALKDLQNAALKADIIYLCSDDDREGEAISFALQTLLNVPQKKMRRAAFHEITPKAIKEAIANPRDLNLSLVDAQQARRALDRIVGYKISPLLWDKIKRGLSAGRVQSVAVRIITEREREIAAFIEEEYWTLNADFICGKQKLSSSLKSMGGKRVVVNADDLEKSKKSDDLIHLDSKKANDLSDSLSTRKYHVSSYDTKEVSERALPPFHTSSMQMASANRLGFDTKRTMNIAQALYEGVKIGAEHVGLITYMRTDSFSISKDAQNACISLIEDKYGAEYIPSSLNYYKSKTGSQGAHECIRPTNVTLTPSDVRTYLQPDMYKLYTLIWERFVSCQMAPAVYDTAVVEIESKDKDSLVFRSTGRKAKFLGWTIVYADDEHLEKQLPKATIGEIANLENSKPESHLTQPPPRYTDASLVKVLEKEGIGRPSTYASIIQTIQDRKYVEKVGTGGRAPFKATDLGMIVNDSLIQGFPKILDLGFTRSMEEDLDKIEDGSKTYNNVMISFYSEFEKELKEAKNKICSTKGGTLSGINCPKCNKEMKKILSNFGFFLKCPEEKCSFAQNIDGSELKTKPKETGLKCDLCNGNVIKASGRFGDYFACEHYADKKCKFTMKVNKLGQPQRKIEAVPSGITCNKCKKEMVIRIASRKKTPDAFLSCSGFPRCRETDKLPIELKEKGETLIKLFYDLKAKDTKDAKNIFKDEE